MKLVVCDNYAKMSECAAEIIARVIKNKPDCILGLATGATPEGIYAELCKKFAAGELSFASVTTVNLDEYYPLAPESEQSYRYFMNYHLFDKTDIDKKNTYVPNGIAPDPDAEAQRYEKLLTELGQVDLQLLGIGKNAHIGFNEPGEYLLPFTHMTKLTQSTIDANKKYFPNEALMPKRALTMGMGSIMRSKEILVVASGVEKHNAVLNTLEGKVRTEYPASFLNLHANVTLVCDSAAYYGKK